jgi:thiazole synthase ThiGH ThiG subunit
MDNSLVHAHKRYRKRLEPYIYEQFYDITVRLLTTTSNQPNVDEEIAKATAAAVCNASTARNIRDCIRVAKMAKSVEDVKWLVKSFL